MKRGTRIFCPICRSFSLCVAIPLHRAGKSKERLWRHEGYPEIAWFRRARECLNCAGIFATAEMDEDFVAEIVGHRERQRVIERSMGKLGDRAPWIWRREAIPKKVAGGLLKVSAWWDHSSGQWVPAPGHAYNLEDSEDGWAIEFGANVFLVGRAIERSRKIFDECLIGIANNELTKDQELVPLLAPAFTQSVANSSGIEYFDYPISKGKMLFGTQAIDLADAAHFLIKESGIGTLLPYPNNLKYLL